jgi:hypothetical protein
MANEFEGLFQTPGQARNEYLSPYMITPAQQSQQGLLQQIVSTMSNAGAGLGYGIGKLAGGSSPQEIEANAVQKAMADVKKQGLANPAAEFSALSNLLQQNPDTQRQASIARQKAFELTKQQEEQQIIQRTAAYRQEIANMPDNLSQEQMLAYTENASRKYGNPEQALDAVKAGYARGAENKRVEAATNVLQKAFAIKDKAGNVVSTMDPVVAAMVAKDKDLTNQLLNDRLQVKDIQTKVITDADSVKLVNAVSGETIKEYGKPTGGAKTSVDVNLGNVFAEASAKAEGKAWGEEWAKMGQNYVSGAQLLPVVREVSDAVQKENLFAGGLATQKLAVAKFIDAFGIPVNEEAIKNTELMRSLTSQMVQKIAKTFPGSQSNKELEQLLASQANFEQNVPTILRLLNKVEIEMTAEQATYRQLSAVDNDKRIGTNKNILYADNLRELQELERLNKKFDNRTDTPKDKERANAIIAKFQLN